MEWTREEILTATGGAMAWQGKDARFSKIVTDSRRVRKRSAFVALEGERLDGHAFLDEALRRGAGCLVVHKWAGTRPLRAATVIRVHNTLRALGDMAHYWRWKAAPKVLAVTGSNGKTTTKEMVAAIAERASLGETRLKGKVLKTAGNYNNLVGLPLTLLALTGRERMAIVELGTSRPGEIRRLTEIADPDIGLITSIAQAHLTGLKSIGGVAREKGALFRGLRPGATAVVNLDDPRIRGLDSSIKNRKITYGRDGNVRAERVKDLAERGVEFTLRVDGRRRRLRLRLSGEHNISNALGAAAMAHAFGAGIKAMAEGLASMKPVPMRMNMERHKGVWIINDAYNANPASMAAALRSLMEIKESGRKIAVLGDMLELGARADQEHRALGKSVARHGVDRLFLLGPHASLVKAGALLGGMAEDRVIIGGNHRVLARRLRKEARRGDWLLLKGSRGMAMEKVLVSYKSMGE